MAPALPIHPTLTHPLTGQPLRAMFVSAKTGRTYWPVLGASEPPPQPPAPQPPAPPAPPAPRPPEPPQPPAPQPDKGFPEGTPVEQMTIEQQAAYWKHNSRKHEDRVKAYGGITPEDAKTFKDRNEQLEYDLSSDTEKKIADAKREADEAAQAKYFPGLATAKLEAAAAGRIEPANLAAAIAPLQASGMGYFKAADGTVDTDKVTSYIDSIAPATGNQQQRTGPSTKGHGGNAGGSNGGRGKLSTVAEVREQRAAERAAKAASKT